MSLSRRELFLGSGGALALGGAALLAWRYLGGQQRKALIVSPARSSNGPLLVILDPATWIATKISVPMLAHSIVGHPTKRSLLYLFGQRPGKTSCVVDSSNGSVVATFGATKGRHFYGHGTMTQDGERFYATETDDESGQGFLTVRSTRDLTVLGETPSFGVAPHELRFSTDGKRMIIANGGSVSLTEDNYPSETETRSNLCYLDAATGKLEQQVTLEDPTISIRHMDVSGDDVMLGMRRYGPRDPGPCVGFHRFGGPIVVPTLDAAQLAQQRSLALSVAIDAEKDLAIATHPNGRCVSLWRLRERSFVGQMGDLAAEGCVVSPDGKGFVVTTQEGVTAQVHAGTRTFNPLPQSANGPNWKHALLWFA